jgi:endonuclease G
MKIPLIFYFFIFIGFSGSCQNPSPKVKTVSLKSLKVNQISDWKSLLPSSTSNVIVKHEFYSLSYKEEFEQAEWVAYELKLPKAKTKFKRPYFTADPKVISQSADWKNYRKSGFDKGHLCAAADMKVSKKAFNDTFYTSNISPQKHNFNNGIWNRLEDKTRFWAVNKGSLFVVTGGVLSSGLPTIGYEKVAIPEYFYKILCSNKNGKLKIIAFLIPHKQSQAGIYDFVVAVDEVEKRTGIDFFKNLEDSLENELESKKDIKGWVVD